LKRFVLLLAAVTVPALAECRFPSDSKGQVLTYTFEPTVTATATVLHVTLKIQGIPDAREQIEVPTQWAGETLHGVVNLHPLSDGVLAYDVVKDWTGRFTHPAEFHGSLLPEYIEVNGANALIHPKLSDLTPVTVHFDWRKLPTGWILATSFGTSSTPDGRCQSYSGPWRTVQQALFTAGEFRVHHFEIRGRPAVLAIRGDWTFTDDEAIADIQKAIGAARQFWHDDNFPYYLVTLKPFDNEKDNGDGSQFTNAYWLYLSRRDSITDQTPTLIHEAFHAWDPARMGVASDEDSDAIKWFSEGFVRYYGYLLALRAGLITFPVYLDGVNRELQESRASTSAYNRGRLIALWLDRQIRKDSKGKALLDNVMHDMVSGAGKPLTEARILATAGRYLSPSSRTQLAQAVQPGPKIPDAADALQPCASGSLDDVATFDLGFDLEASKVARKVTGVVPDGPAFRAGLRDGQPLDGRLSVYYNQPDKLAIVTVKLGDTRKAVEYYPQGKPVRLLQYHYLGGNCSFGW
jgi:predicted metalloprotease with PDZ domain